jgi:hypothetical protein
MCEAIDAANISVFAANPTANPKKTSLKVASPSVKGLHCMKPGTARIFPSTTGQMQMLIVSANSKRIREGTVVSPKIGMKKRTLTIRRNIITAKGQTCGSSWKSDSKFIFVL